MDRIIKRVDFPKIMQPQFLKVCAYTRVSSGKDAMLHSLSAQISHYSELIQSHTGWVYCGVYSDEALTGTKSDRDGFQQMLADCRAGKIDMVITKSISRFARNTVTLLETVRELKSLGIDVFFEEQNIHTMSADGELMLTILASYAQEESRSVSENQKWRVKRNFEAGIPWNGRMLGYRMQDGKYYIIPEEAELVRRIYRDFLDGMGRNRIAAKLNDEGIQPTRYGEEWHPQTIAKILRNYAYTGNLLLQRFYCESYITKKTVPNNGQKQCTMRKEPMKPLSLWMSGKQRRQKLNGELNSTNRSRPHSRLSFTPVEFSAQNAGRTSAEKQQQCGSFGSVPPSTPKGKSTALPSRYRKPPLTNWCDRSLMTLPVLKKSSPMTITPCTFTFQMAQWSHAPGQIVHELKAGRRK